ncbi:RNA-directed DNA polymerase from mobile element jockey [Rhipicephalus sanguineus]|uniref:RNA-directed DNA polymerase from mobile element jockey n=1 Tax=Rhipicephalus sanguineus TaxID=34632 RepID=UPI0020C4BDDD|nr:RNA-directed DNA polymerase from mobile element jockey [Rhipicephalus sanguineus]
MLPPAWTSHQQGLPRCAVYVRRELLQAEVPVADLVGGPFECCAVRVRLGGDDTTVASVYVRPGLPWDPRCLRQLAHRLGKEFLLCGDVNAKNPAWGGRRTDARGREVLGVLQQLGLLILNTGANTFIRRGAHATSSAIDLSVATEGCRYRKLRVLGQHSVSKVFSYSTRSDEGFQGPVRTLRYAWTPLPDTWGSDHLPILLSPFRGKAPRDREYRVVDWQVYRRLFRQDTGGRDLLQLVADSARAATVIAKVQQGRPVPDIRHLALRAARRRAERQALSKALPELWTEFRRVDAVCRRHARRRRNQGWLGVCISIDRSRDGTKAWRLLRCLLTVPRAFNQVLSLAIHLCIGAAALTEQLADQFAARDVAQLPAAPPPAALPCPASCHHPGWASMQVRELCGEPITMHELVAALEGSKRRSAPGADGITFQMLRNLDGAGRQRLLEYYNDVWSTGVLPESRRTAVVAPILKPRRKATALSSYRPVSLTSAPCKVMEKVALERLEWIADHLGFFPEQQTGFRRHRCTADSISDVVATLEDARSSGDAAMLLLLDVESAFDGLPHVVVEAALDRLGVSGSLRGFVTAFLSGRTFCVRVGRETSQPRDITAGVPQGSVLSPFLFNMALAGLPASLPTDTRFPAHCSVSADDVALWVRGPRRSIPAVRRSLQAALEAVITYLGGIGLKVSATKTEALLIHPLAAARNYVKQLRVGNRKLPWRLTVKYLGLTIDHRLTWIPAAKAAAARVRRVQGAIGKLQQRGQGCSTRWALRLNQAAASSVLLYAFPLVALTPARRRLLEGLHRSAVRAILGLPKCSPVAATLAEAGEWPLTLRMLQRALGHIDRLHRATDGRALLERLRNQPGSRMGGLCLLYHEMVPDPPVPVAPPPPHHRPPEVHLHLEGATKRRTPAATLQQAAACKLQEQLEERLQVFTDGSVISTAAELAGLHLAADLLAEDIPAEPVAVLCDSKAALQILANRRRDGLTANLLTAKFRALSEAGVSVSFHWLPSHVGIAGNEEADALAKAAHQPGIPFSQAVAARDYSQARLKRLLVTVHPDTRVANGRGPKLLPETGLTRKERAALLRLRTGCVWTAARRHAKGRCTSPACSRCGDPETLEHLLCACPGLAQERSRVIAAYRSQGLPASTLEHLLFPSRPHLPALRSPAEFLEETGIAAYR